METTAAKKKKKVFDAKKKMQNMTREQINIAIEKKKECTAKAMSIVEKLIEPGVEEMWLLDNLYHINQCHFQDAVEERAIIKCCGYPLCDNTLKDIPKKQFHISTKQNKVFDITDRKNYCSNICYKAGVFLKDQLYSSPLWLRDCEEIVTYQLYCSTTTSGITGQEVDLGNTSPIQPEKETDKQNQENEKNNETMPVEIEEKNASDSDDENFQDARDYCDLDIISDKLNATEHNHDETPCEGVKDEFFLIKTNSNDSDDHLDVCNSEIGSEPTQQPTDDVTMQLSTSPDMTRIDKRKSTGKSSSDQSSTKKLKPNLPVGNKIESFVLEWFTVDSLTFLYGEQGVKEKFQEFGSPLNEIKFNKLKDSCMYERYEEICRRLNILEIRDREEVAQTPSKPLPDYEQLKRESKELELKVRSFYKGDSRVEFQMEEDSDKKDKGNEEGYPVLPLIDHHAIRATRRRIMLDKLNRTLPDILSALNLGQFNARKAIKDLVYTLSLSATNIVMKPSEWNLVAIILIRIITIKDGCLKQAYLSDITQRRMVNLLMAYSLDLNYLERQVLNINDVEIIIRNSQ